MLHGMQLSKGWFLFWLCFNRYICKQRYLCNCNLCIWISLLTNPVKVWNLADWQYSKYSPIYASNTVQASENSAIPQALFARITQQNLPVVVVRSTAGRVFSPLTPFNAPRPIIKDMYYASLGKYSRPISATHTPKITTLDILTVLRTYAPLKYTKQR